MAGRNPLDELPAETRARLRKLPRPTWVAPMLATLTDERFSRAGWLFEPKRDGERCLAFRDGRNLHLFSRNRKRLNDKYPEITAAFHRQKTDAFIADGEIADPAPWRGVSLKRARQKLESLNATRRVSQEAEV